MKGYGFHGNHSPRQSRRRCHLVSVVPSLVMNHWCLCHMPERRNEHTCELMRWAELQRIIIQLIIMTFINLNNYRSTIISIAYTVYV